MSLKNQKNTKVVDLKNKSEIEKAQETILKERKERAELCSQEINAVLEKHKCTAIVSGRFEGNQIQAGLNIVAQ